MTDRNLGNIEQMGENRVESIDVPKLLRLVKKSLLYILAFFILGISVSYLFIRYTKPLYESSSLIKLNFKSEANNLGLVSSVGLQQEFNEISGEIEILKSKVFLKKVVEVVNYPVSYFAYGTYLVDERFGNSPFEVSFKVFDQGLYDRKIDITILDNERFELDFLDNTESKIYRFGEEIMSDRINLLIEKTNNFNESVYGKYFFTINSENSLISYFQDNMIVQPENFNAKTIKIALQDFNKYKAQTFVRAIDTLYLNYSRMSKNQAIEQKINFLDKQIEATESKLQYFEEYFENFTIENKTVSLESDLSYTIQLLNSLDSQRFILKNYYNTVKVLDDQLEKDQPAYLNPYLVQQMPKFIIDALQEYETILQERDSKLMLYNEETAVISRIDAQLTTAKNNLQDLIDEHLKNYEEELIRLERKVNALESNLVQLPSMGTEYNKNKRLYELQENFILSLRQSKMELEITRAGTVADSIILSNASLPYEPVKPRKLIVFGLGFVVAFITSIIFILVRYLMNNKISTVRELERITSIPILGSIPEYRQSKLEVTKLVVKKGSKSAVGESLRSIRTNLEFFKPLNETKLISISSTISGEGKTFVAVNLGSVIASSKKKICIVDLDMRKPKVHLAFENQQLAHGVSTLLIGKSKLDECINETSQENLFYISAGPIPPNPSELLLGKEFEELIEELKERFDLIILDTPPVGLVTDGVLVMKKSDIQLYVLKADYSRRGFVKTLEYVNSINNFKRMGLILNSVQYGSSKYGSGHYGDYGKYGYGYGYYEEKVEKKKVLNIW